MAVKKSELYSKLWASCDELRGGMDASEYKDYVLIMLFIKYISDKYAGVPYAPITVPSGASFDDMILLKGKPTIGDDINKKIIGPIEDNNKSLGSIKVDFDNPEKLGTGKEKVERLTKLISIFEGLNFSKNKAEGDDLLGDAYEYLMRNFATESGKSKGQFYTPSEVSRIMAKIIGINDYKTSADTTIYDPTCGSGSLLLKVADEAEKKITIYGQEKESATAGLARMNMVLHDCPTALIKCTGNSTLSDPQFLDNGGLKQFDFIVANPPFSIKSWRNGVYDTAGDINEIMQPNTTDYGRFKGFGIPPEKNGDYAFLLHILRSLKSKGKAAVILPHGVLFRGNAEAEIRKNLILKGYIKGIIGLPANLFYGTGIPACLIVLDKENADNRKAIFMIDASKGFIKDGNKNRLRSQDIHKIVDVFNKQLELPKYSRIVTINEIEKNEFNLNLPRYIDSQEVEDIQDIAAHLLGGIPNADIDVLQDYWKVYPSLRKQLFKDSRRGYSQLMVEQNQIKNEIFSHPEFVTFSKDMDNLFSEWKKRNTVFLKSLTPIAIGGVKPKQIIHHISEDVLQTYSDKALMDKYDIYQHLMSYWNDIMQDDCYLIAVDGWKAEPYRIIQKTKVKGKEDKQVDKGWDCDLVPKSLVIDRFFLAEKNNIEQLVAERDSVATTLQEIEEEHSGDEGFFAGYDKVNKANVQKRLKEILSSKPKTKLKKDNLPLAAEAETAYGSYSPPLDGLGEVAILEQYIELTDKQTELNKMIKEAEVELDKVTLERYKTLTETEVKQLVVDDKWIASIERSVKTEMERISQRLTQRIKELAERYETALPKQTTNIAELEKKVINHLQKMGFVWNN